MSAHLYRPVVGRIQLHTPYMEGNRRWLLDLGIRPTRDKATKRWLVSRGRLFELADASADRFGRCVVVTEHRASEQCHAACQGALGDECVCSCLGKNHGGGRALGGWVEVGAGVLVSEEIIQATWVVER